MTLAKRGFGGPCNGETGALSSKHGEPRTVTSRRFALRSRSIRVDPKSPFNFHLTIAHFHKTQGRIIAAFAKLLPDVADKDWTKLWNSFAPRINELWAALEKTYVDEMAESGGEPGDA